MIIKKIRFTLFMIAALVLSGVLAACGPKAEEPITESQLTVEYQKISAEAAKARIDSGDDVIILDVRTQGEYDDKHIPGAILIPNETIGSEPPQQLPNLDQEILIYCRSGNRSAQAAKKLIEMGYTNIYDFGGINDWSFETDRNQ